MKRLSVIGAVVLQVFVLGYMAAEREWILHAGRTVWLRTAPVDPRDVMRGDYVRLDYDISRAGRRLWSDGLTNQSPPAEHPASHAQVYASLRPGQGPGGCAEITALSDRRPAEGLFLRGRVETSRADVLQVRYGIEALFMEQGRARELEDQRAKERQGLPLNMEVAIGAQGAAVIKGYRWETLGITLELESAQRTNRAGRPARQETSIVAAKVQLKNHGTNDLALVILPEGRSFALVCDTRWGEARYSWPGETNALPQPRPKDVIVLKPGQSHATRLDLTRPEWFVLGSQRAGAPKELKAIQAIDQDWSTRFRIEYRAPSAEACAGLPRAGEIYHGRLASRAFDAVGSVD